MQTSIDGRGYSTHEQGCMEISRHRSMMNLSSFHCFVCFPVEWPTRMSNKKYTTQRTAQGNLWRDAWPRRVFFKAAMLDWYYTPAVRYGSTKDVAQEIRSSTESEPEERRQEKPGCSCSAKWKLGWCSIRLCFLDMVPYKEDTTPSLFRTRFVRCYALPCISIKLWRSTCKPYSLTTACLRGITVITPCTVGGTDISVPRPLKG